MARREVISRNVKDIIYDSLNEQIVSEQLVSGDKLPSVRSLAEKHSCSRSPVCQALQELKNEGFLISRHGKGTYVSSRPRPFNLTQSTVIALGSVEEHVWGELDRLLTNRLHKTGRIPLIVDQRSQAGIERLMALAHSDVSSLIIVGHPDFFPIHLLQETPLNSKLIISIASWRGPEPPRLIKVLTDYDEGGRLAARFLHERGHRRVALINPFDHEFPSRAEAEQYEKGDDFHDPYNRLKAFMNEWSKRGGEWAGIRALKPKDENVNTGQTFNEAQLLDLFCGPNPCTAAFAVLDNLAFSSQKVLHTRAPELNGNVEFVGYFNTPWSSAAIPPYSSISLDLETIAERVCHLLDAAPAGNQPCSTTETVNPVLIRHR